MLRIQVKEICTPKRTLSLILVMVIYQMTFIFLLFLDPGPPYDVLGETKSIYFMSSFSLLSFVCFFFVVVSTTLLVVRLKQNLEWRNEAAKQSSKSSGNPKEIKAARSVVAICTIFIMCFTPNVALVLTSLVYPKFNQHDPYLGTLMIALHAICTMLQVLSSAVNIVVYYRMSTKYREVFNSMYCR